MNRYLRLATALTLLVLWPVILHSQTRTRRSTPQRRRTPAVQPINQSVMGQLDTGNQAAAAGKHDAAIAAYDQGLAVEADEPALLVNKAIALLERGDTRFEKFNKTRTASLKSAAGTDWLEAAETARKAIESIKNRAPDATNSQSQNNLKQMTLAALGTRAAAMRLVASKVDQSRAQEACSAHNEYLAAETDAGERQHAILEASNYRLKCK